MLGWLALGGLLLILAGSGRGGSGPVPAPPGPLPPAGYPTIESIASVMCVLFGTTHAVAPPAQLLADSLFPFAVTSAQLLVARPAVHQAAVALSEGLYAGTVTCSASDADANADPYAPSTSKCPRNGASYNAALWPSPASVIAELRQLAFGQQIPASSSITSSAWRAEIKRFQAIARSLNLSGLVNAPESYIDGIVGACSLLALTEARAARLRGAWPYALVTGAG